VAVADVLAHEQDIRTALDRPGHRDGEGILASVELALGRQDPWRRFESTAGVRHQLNLMCDDIATTVDELRSKGVDVRGEPLDEGWGITTTLVLPGGVDVMLYEPRHPTAI
jgi:hypothetical protein